MKGQGRGKKKKEKTFDFLIYKKISIEATQH